MNLKNFVVLASLFLLLSLSIGMVSANENMTLESDGINPEQYLGDLEEDYDVEIEKNKIYY